MRITRRPPTTIPGLGETAPTAETTDTTTASGGGAVTDRVQLSEAARLRQRLKAEIGDPSQSTSDRVQALQADIANQTYAPSPRAVADRLLGELAADLLA
jgi:flagellar biosynthesis anti-sigma factor FlgM